MNGISNQEHSVQSVPHQSGHFKVYKWRWFILATLAILNISNALQWLSFAPVAYITADFYQIDTDTVNMLSVVYMITAIPCGFVATYLLDTFGLRWSIVISAWLNVVGSIVRIISAMDGVSDSSRVPLVFFGTVLAALAQPFMLFAPTKLAAIWFPDNQRATANMLATMCNPLGIMLAQILSPILAKNKSDMMFMLAIESIPGILAVLMATFGVCSNEPATPPSASAESPSEPFLKGLKALLKNRMYWLLAWAIGGGIALFSVLNSLLVQMLCPWGYTDEFVGVVCGSSMIGAGLVGGLFAGLLVDHTKRYIEVTKVCYSIAALSLIAFSVMHNRSYLWAPIAISCGVFGFFGLPVYPIGNELSVETTYPVGEATSSGIIFMFGQLQGVVLVLVLSSIGKTIENPEHSECNTNSDGKSNVPVTDMTIPTYVMTGYSILVLLVFVLVFRTKYKRLEAESKKSTPEDSLSDADIAPLKQSPIHENKVDIDDEEEESIEQVEP